MTAVLPRRRTVADMVTVLDEDLYPHGLEQGYATDAGLDLLIRETYTAWEFETYTAPLGISVAVPEHFYGLIVPRSSAARSGLLTPPVLIDPGYTGEVHAFLTCTRPRTYTRGDSLVSLVVAPLIHLPGGTPRRSGAREGKADGSSTR